MRLRRETGKIKQARFLGWLEPRRAEILSNGSQELDPTGARARVDRWTPQGKKCSLGRVEARHFLRELPLSIRLQLGEVSRQVRVGLSACTVPIWHSSTAVWCVCVCGARAQLVWGLTWGFFISYCVVFLLPHDTEWAFCGRDVSL